MLGVERLLPAEAYPAPGLQAPPFPGRWPTPGGGVLTANPTPIQLSTLILAQPSALGLRGGPQVGRHLGLRWAEPSSPCLPEVLSHCGEMSDVSY